jgi:hypothetical protein
LGGESFGYYGSGICQYEHLFASPLATGNWKAGVPRFLLVTCGKKEISKKPVRVSSILSVLTALEAMLKR